MELELYLAAPPGRYTRPGAVNINSVSQWEIGCRSRPNKDHVRVLCAHGRRTRLASRSNAVASRLKTIATTSDDVNELSWREDRIALYYGNLMDIR